MRSTFFICSSKRSFLFRNKMMGFSGYRRLHAMSKRLMLSFRLEFAQPILSAGECLSFTIKIGSGGTYRFCFTSSRNTWLYSVRAQTKMTAVISPVKFHFGLSIRCPPTSITLNLALLAWKSMLSIVRVGSRTFRISSFEGMKPGFTISSTLFKKLQRRMAWFKIRVSPPF